MGANKNKNAPTQVAKQGESGGDPRGRTQNVNAYQQQRFEGQMDPVLSNMGENYGRASEQGFQDYGDIMSGYKGFAGGKAMPHIGYSDPFASYGGYQNFADTGGYSAGDVANLRARGVSPIRAAYANAEREMGRNKSLQGGYSPNAAASLVKMAREQGQSAADAVQNVEGGIVNQRNANKLAGLGGMSNIEGQRLGADLDVGKFNASADMQGMQNQLAAMQGMTSLYGTSPGMATQFGNQLLEGINTSGNFGSNMAGHEAQAGALPGQFDDTMGKVGKVAEMAYPWLQDWKNKQPSTPAGAPPPDWFGGGTTQGQPTQQTQPYQPTSNTGTGVFPPPLQAPQARNFPINQSRSMMNPQRPWVR